MAASILGRNQGVYVESADGSVLVSRLAARGVHPASVSKIATSLALLHKLGPEHRFLTTFSLTGCTYAGTLNGDLVVQGQGDPSLVDEDALLVAEKLKRMGIQQIAGRLQLLGPLTFDWLNDGDGAGLRRALSGSTPRAAWTAVSELTSASAGAPGLPESPGIRFVRGQGLTPTRDVAAVPDARTVIEHRSQALLPLLKGLNDYSNNIFKPFADVAGGPAAIEAFARSVVPEAMQSEIILADGAGSSPDNRLSPRAAVRLLRSLEQELAATGHKLVDVLPVAGVDEGTLLNRIDAPDELGRVVGKTGTYGEYGASALVGAIRTEELGGTVYFAVLNHGVPVPQARRRQDRFVRMLLQRLRTVPWEYSRDDRPAVARTDVSVILPPAATDAGKACARGS
jgi:D-alanyl-D-alanine carboxypeptidase/D-alanyl-D-alanine-endopeptidase (penicillin-binding protein 4)